MSQPILEVNHLQVHFFTDRGQVKAVDDVDFQVETGKTHCIVGESGCGKSVTSMALLRLVQKPGKIVGGTALYKGQDLLQMDDAQIRKIRGNEISMIFQEPMTSLNPVFTIGAQIMESLILHQHMTKVQAKAKAIELLQQVNIPRADKIIQEYPHQLSGGMRQRVMIAMAFACKPGILIADEPTTALDVTIQAQILEFMNELKAQYNTAIILITHDLGVVAEMADEVTVMYAGKVVESAPVTEIFANPRHPYTVGLLNSKPSIHETRPKLEVIEGNVPNPAHLPSGCYFHPRCKYARDDCRVTLPGLEELGGNTPHKVRCFYAGEVSK